MNCRDDDVSIICRDTLVNECVQCGKEAITSRSQNAPGFRMCYECFAEVNNVPRDALPLKVIFEVMCVALFDNDQILLMLDERMDEFYEVGMYV